MECIFCKIARGDFNTDFVYHDEKIVAFHDLKPQAPTHLLIIPRLHIATFNDINDQHHELLSHLLLTAKKIAAQINIAQAGYRLVVNCNANGGQEVLHLHLHLLGGRRLHWPPG